MPPQVTLELRNALAWQPPSDHRVVRTIDAHTGGEPFRVLLEGGVEIPGDTILRKRRWAEEHADALRRLLMLEPRGHSDMYGCLLTPPVGQGSHFGVLFMHNAGFSTMCGHGIIAVTKVVLDTGILEMSLDSEVRIDSPAGLIRAAPTLGDNGVEAVSFLNVPSFASLLDKRVSVPGFGDVTFDLAFGGAFYAFVDVAQLGLKLQPERASEIIAAGRAIKHAVAGSFSVEHPTDPDLGFLYGVIFTDTPRDGSHHSRHTCVFADGEVDRSPTGTGVSARVAILHARALLSEGDEVTIESIVGSTFTGSVDQALDWKGIPAVIPRVTGSAHISGMHTFVLDPQDPFPTGFFVR